MTRKTYATRFRRATPAASTATSAAYPRLAGAGRSSPLTIIRTGWIRCPAASLTAAMAHTTPRMVSAVAKNVGTRARQPSWPGRGPGRGLVGGRGPVGASGTVVPTTTISPQSAQAAQTDGTEDRHVDRSGGRRGPRGPTLILPRAAGPVLRPCLVARSGHLDGCAHGRLV